MKTVLIADDDAAVRRMLSRLLMSQHWNIVEATDGLSALTQIESQHIDLVLLDLRLPHFSGDEVLEVIRSSAAHSKLPVVLVTGFAEPERLASMVQLGLSDCLVKPLTPELVRERLKRFDPGGAPATRRRVSPDKKTGGVLVVDASPEHRSFVCKMLMHRYRMVEAASGLAAVKMCVDGHPSVVIAASDIGLMSPQSLAQKLRSHKELRATRLVLVAGEEGVTEAGLFDAVMTRTFVPDEFMKRFDAALARSFDDDTDVLSDVRRRVESATEQAVGMMAATTVKMTRVDASAMAPGHMQASVDVQLETERVAFRVTLRCSPNDARAVGGKLRSMDVAEVSVEDGLATLGELTGAVTGGLSAWADSVGDKASLTSPALVAETGADEGGSSDVVLSFAPPGGEFEILVVLQILPSSLPTVAAA
jgi:CheY-like chemotaxis protein